MKRNLDTFLKTLDGKTYEDKATLKSVLFAAVAATLDSDKGEDKMMLYGLASKIHAGGVVDFTAEEIALMKKRVQTVYPILVVGSTITLLEQDSTDVKKEKL
mgnify:CR=1 FL=1